MSEEVIIILAGGYEKKITQDHATRVCYVSSSIVPAIGQSQMPIFATSLQEVLIWKACSQYDEIQRLKAHPPNSIMSLYLVQWVFKLIADKTVKYPV